MIQILNENCFDTMRNMDPTSIDIVLTSPFYNTNKKANKNRTLLNTRVKEDQYNYVRYDVHVDNMSNEDYCVYTKNLFDQIERVLKPNGCVLYNMSYGSENTEGMWLTVAYILQHTNFTVTDCIVWKKKIAFPNASSPNKLTRICEYVFVFCRKNELLTFHCNKRITSYRKTGQAAYENVCNFIEARNNDGQCPYNKAAYSTELCEWLLKLYAPKNGTVYDPFLGTGTTAIACQNLGLNCIGSEISSNQCEWAKQRLSKNTKEKFCLKGD